MVVASQSLLLLTWMALLRTHWGTAPPISPRCSVALDAFCGNASEPDLRSCYALLQRRGEKLPMLAGLSGPCYIPGHCTARWHCYSPSDLVGPDPAALPVGQRRFNGHMCWPNGTGVCNCSRSLLQVLDGCEGTNDGAVEVFRSVAVIPALVFQPASPLLPNGSLVAFSEGCGGGPRGAICSRRSTDHGRSWSRNVYPVAAAGLPPRPGPNGGWAQPQAVYDPRTKAILLQFTNETSERPGGCDNDAEQLGGILQVSSTDAGVTWGRFLNVQHLLMGSSQRSYGNRSLSCLAPTSGQGVSMNPVNGRYGGRLVFCAVRNPYQGDIPVWSDDGGVSPKAAMHRLLSISCAYACHGSLRILANVQVTYNFSSDLNIPGLDECNIAQAANGSLILIARSCDRTNLGQCGMMEHQEQKQKQYQQQSLRSGSNSSGTSVGSKTFAMSVSTDGGEHWGPVIHQSQLVTPVCQASMISYRGPADRFPVLYFSGPYSTTTRKNGTILASDDNGVTFSRSLNIFPYERGVYGYSSLACGMNAEKDCGVIFDNGDRLLFLPFKSADVKAARPPSPAPNGRRNSSKPVPISGWLGLYGSPTGGMDARTPAGETVAETFRFGTAAIVRGSRQSGALAEYCTAMDVNTLWGLTGLGSHGQINNPRDDDPWEPPSAAEGGAGLIQAAHHWSTMAADCPQISGIIIDDFLGAYYADDPYSRLDLDDVRDVKAALVGKPVDVSTGRVNHSAPATAPHLQLLVVIYTSELNSSLCRRLGVNGTNTCLIENEQGRLFGPDAVDGVSFWPGGEDPAYPLSWGEDENGDKYPALFRQLRAVIPSAATVLTGTYLAGSGREGDSPHGKKYVHWFSPEGVSRSIKQAAHLCVQPHVPILALCIGSRCNRRCFRYHISFFIVRHVSSTPADRSPCCVQVCHGLCKWESALQWDLGGSIKVRACRDEQHTMEQLRTA